jgi:hypothetical protein
MSKKNGFNYLSVMFMVFFEIICLFVLRFLVTMGCFDLLPHAKKNIKPCNTISIMKNIGAGYLRVLF